MTTPFTVYDSTNEPTTTLTNALLAANSGITINSSSIVLSASGSNAVNLYDGSLALGIGAGLLLTTGTTPETTNTLDWFGTDNNGNGDADIDTVVNTVFQTQSFDATTLSFNFTVADANATSVSFDIVFGSDEYPEWVDQFVDSAVVMVNGVNYALFNHDSSHPLSVISSNLAAGYFQDNTGNVLPIEYDGISHVLKIVAPINSGVGTINQIKIGIADTGDHIYDSGIFLANFAAGTIPGSGVVSLPTTGTDSSDNMTGSSKDEFFDLKAGDDTVYAGAGDDIVVAGNGNDSVYGGSGDDQMKGDAGDDSLDGGDGLSDTAVFSGVSTDYTVVSVGGSYTITDSKTEGTDTLTNVEYAQFGDGLFILGANGLTAVSNPNTPPSNTAGSVLINGIGSVGNTLTATVNDADGIAGAINYQWQISSDNGVSWNNVGTDSATYTLSNADVGMIQVIASYTDNASQSEVPISVAKSILQANNGDLSVTLMQLTAPQGASNINPLTTLVQNAIDLGISSNMATLDIKTALGLPADINLKTYDAYAVLQTNPNDATALAVEKVAVQIAVLTSLSSDESGVNLTLAILNAAANNQTLNLADAHDLATILGIDITGITDKNLYPQPLREIFDRNSNIAESNSISAIEQEWQDLLSIQDGINSTSIADLSIHVNQAPIGSATANLATGLENTDYIVSTSDLLLGFSDTDGGTLSVSGLSTSNGTVTDNGDNTFTITPPQDYIGPIELIYTVEDGQGGSTTANQLFGIAPLSETVVNHAPTGLATASLVDGTEDIAYIVSATDLLTGFSDVDGDTLSVSGLYASDGIVVDNLDGTFTITPTLNFNGVTTVNYEIVDGNVIVVVLPFGVQLNYNVIDGNGGSIAATQGYILTAVNDTPVLTSPALINYTDTIFDDTFATVTGSLVANDVDNDWLTYGITGGTDNGGTVSLSNVYGVLTVTKATGAYSFVANDATIEALKSSATNTFTVTVSDGLLTDSKTLTINIVQNGVTESSGIDTLTGTSANDKFDALAGNDIITGLAGDDIINGGAGADKMTGGTGNDSYYIDNISDSVVENANQGVDTVYSTVTHTLTANVENSVLTGAMVINGTGNTLNNQLTGNNANNTLSGVAGADTLDGQGGADILIGGLGKDSYTLTETTAATDTVRVAKGDSLVASYDVVQGFHLGSGTVTTGVDKLDLASTLVAANATTVNGVDSGTIMSHHISNGIISFDDTNTYAAPVTITATNLNNVISYLQANITKGNTVAFVSEGNTFVFQDGGTTDTLVELVGVSANSLNNTGLTIDSVWIV